MTPAPDARLILIGAGGHGKVVADVAAAVGWQNIAFLDRSFPDRRENGAWPIIGNLSEALPLREAGACLFLSIGNNSIRARLWEGLSMADSPMLIDPDASVSKYANIGAGTLVVRGAAVNTAAYIGKSVIVNTGATIDHDCDVSDFAHISPGANLSGTVTVGARSWIGVGSAVRENITIGSDVTVGAGAAVVKDVADGLTVVSAPARPMPSAVKGGAKC